MFTGLRPGEKKYESLVSFGPKPCSLRPRCRGSSSSQLASRRPVALMRRRLDQLEAAARGSSHGRMRWRWSRRWFRNTSRATLLSAAFPANAELAIRSLPDPRPREHPDARHSKPAYRMRPGLGLGQDRARSVRGHARAPSASPFSRPAAPPVFCVMPASPSPTSPTTPAFPRSWTAGSRLCIRRSTAEFSPAGETPTTARRWRRSGLPGSTWLWSTSTPSKKPCGTAPRSIPVSRPLTSAARR